MAKLPVTSRVFGSSQIFAKIKFSQKFAKIFCKFHLQGHLFQGGVSKRSLGPALLPAFEALWEQRCSQSRLGCFFREQNFSKKFLKSDQLYRGTFEALWLPKEAKRGSFNKSKAGHFLKIKKWPSKGNWEPIPVTGTLFNDHFCDHIVVKITWLLCRKIMQFRSKGSILAS